MRLKANRSAGSAEAARAAMFGGPRRTLHETLVRLAALAAFVLSLGTIIALSFVNRADMDVKRNLPTPYVPPAALKGPASAKALSDESQWITADDYPPAAIRAEQQGTTTIKWTVGLDGRVHDCHAVVSSGHSILDQAGCKALTRRARYLPALDANGIPIVMTRTRRIIWRLPDE